jgi:mutator protein MutT
MSDEGDPLLTSTADDGYVPPMVALSAVVYAERGDDILLLKRAEGSALAGQWFIPGGMVELGERPEDAALRELREEAGVEIDGELEIVGCYPMFVYGYDMLQISFRGRVAEGSEVVISHEHDGVQWAKASDLRLLMTDEVIEQIAQGREQVRTLLGHIRVDLDRYLARVTR